MSITVTSGRKSLLPLRLHTTTINSSPPSVLMPSVADNKRQIALTVGTRVLVNGIKSGTLRYIGTVKFAQGEFCGVELDQADGKHDGQVQSIRYFQCPTNHGIFVPRDKVVPESRTRPTSTQRPASRLKPPTITRSVTLTSSLNQIVSPPEPNPNSNPPPVSINQPSEIQSTVTIEQTSTVVDHRPVVNEVEPLNEKIVEMPSMPLPSALISIDEPDFTANVSLILHQLQQDENQRSTRTPSIMLTEEDTDDEETDQESVAESIVHEKRESDVVEIPVKIPQAISKVTVPTKKNVTKMTTPSTVPQKKIIKPTKTIIATPSRKNLAAPVKKMNNKTTVNPAQSVVSLPSRSKFNSSMSSLNSSQSDLRSVRQTVGQNCQRRVSQMSESLQPLKDELAKQEALIQSMRINEELVKKNYYHLLKRFDVLSIFARCSVEQFDQSERRYQRSISKIQNVNEQLRTSIEQIQSMHQIEIDQLKKSWDLQINKLNDSHQEKLRQTDEKYENLLKEKNDLEQRCSTLQSKVDEFLEEMANSQHADVLLCHVERLEKDRTSLQSVLEMKNQEVTQLRTKLNEQVFQLQDISALQKRVEMAENRNQDLTYLLRQRQLEEKAALIERDQFKEQVAQLDRENRQLKFQNETLQYRLGQSAPAVELVDESPATSRKHFRTKRSRSFSSSRTNSSDNEILPRSSSLNSLNLR